jgi:hypothetical protein
MTTHKYNSHDKMEISLSMIEEKQLFKIYRGHRIA